MTDRLNSDHDTNLDLDADPDPARPRLNGSAGIAAAQIAGMPGSDSRPCLRQAVERALENYFTQLGDESATDLYNLVLSEVEVPLLEAVLQHTGSNQSKASVLLGLNRGTLRKKLKQYGLL